MYVYRVFVPAHNPANLPSTPPLQRAAQDLSNGIQNKAFGQKLVELWPFKVALSESLQEQKPNSQWSQRGLELSVYGIWHLDAVL